MIGDRRKRFLYLKLSIYCAGMQDQEASDFKHVPQIFHYIPRHCSLQNISI